MPPYRALFAAKAAFSLALAASPAIAQTAAAPQPPAGQYYMDKAHTSVVFRVSHLGFSHYTARFSRVDGTLAFDPDHPTAMKVEATIDPTSLELNTPPAGFHDQLMGKSWFEAAQFPQITFRSTSVELTGPHAAKVTGDLTLHGVTKPVVLDVTYNGGWPPNNFDPGGARIGFSAHGVLKRSAYGISYGVPAPGSSMGVSDEVDVAIETEFSSTPAK
ncbi:YceI family protein [Phenylobacterium montanum]|uniref:Polyisoprenoid-binding protein n=1 Tax=Phenylobacterium montanum TaxID=2823693 RepID=A0A975FW00_9CAUL|nr:YceI family protein [Caulobacter sp. S6]QUD85972.1 polyisoprenoid-binding protein [Caulobacter sp. S6]